MNIPDYVVPIIGYRFWLWDGSRLVSLNGESWPPAQPLTTRCRFTSHNCHQPPHQDCSCGIYAAKSADELGGMPFFFSEIHGEVYLWDTVVEHELGWRAQFACPKRFVLSLGEWWCVQRLVQGAIVGSVRLCLEPLTAYGADIYLAHEKGDIPLWTACSG